MLHQKKKNLGHYILVPKFHKKKITHTRQSILLQGWQIIKAHGIRHEFVVFLILALH